MSEILFSQEHTLILADYHDPALHRHLASHLVVSATDKPIEWDIEGRRVCARGLFVDSDIEHACITDSGESIILLFTGVSRFTQDIRRNRLDWRPCFLLDDETNDKIASALSLYRGDLAMLDKKIMEICGFDRIPEYSCDPRIDEAIKSLSAMETISPDVVGLLSRQVFLSKSRFEHLFREQTGMTLHSYIAFEKLRLAARYLQKGLSITQSGMLAGFDSPSHCAATCKRMFGISFRDIMQTIATK